MTTLYARPIETIAIDGPAGSGKSTVGLGLAKQLGFLYFDTGVMYRAATLAALRQGLAMNDEAAISEMAEGLHIEVLPPDRDDGRQYTVRVDGEDVTWDIRTPGVEANVSSVSAYPRVRKAMVKQQRRVAANGQVIMVGRDIGTVVMPDADLKIYLVASVEARAQRRHRELMQRGQPSDYESVLASMRERDRIDMTRAESPLRPAADALIVDCTDMDASDTLDYVLKLVEAQQKAAVVREA
jgi:cytidylate kinase